MTFDAQCAIQLFVKPYIVAVPNLKIKYDCLSCNAQCCHFVSNQSKLIVPKQTASTLKKENPALDTVLSEQIGHHFLSTHKRCWFLKDNQCQIHQEHGEKAKPHQCQIYPLSLKEGVTGIPILTFKPCPTTTIVSDGSGISLKESVHRIEKLRQEFGLYFDELIQEKSNYRFWSKQDVKKNTFVIDFLNQYFKELKENDSIDSNVQFLSQFFGYRFKFAGDQLDLNLLPIMLTEDLFMLSDINQWPRQLQYYFDSIVKTKSVFLETDGSFSNAWEASRRSLEQNIMTTSLRFGLGEDFEPFEQENRMFIRDRKNYRLIPLDGPLGKLVPKLDGEESIEEVCKKHNLQLNGSHKTKIQSLAFNRSLVLN